MNGGLLDGRRGIAQSSCFDKLGMRRMGLYHDFAVSALILSLSKDEDRSAPPSFRETPSR